MFKKCEICNKKIGLFSKPFTTDTGAKVCTSCTSYVDPIFLTENITTAESIAFDMDNELGNSYLAKIGKESPSDLRKKEEEAAKQELLQKQKEEAERQEILKQAQETIAKAKRQKIYHFKVRGVSHYDLSKLVSYARKNDLIFPYDGFTASEIKEICPYEKVFETDLVGTSLTISLIPEPENKYDPNAIKVIATHEEKQFMLGYVPTEHTKEVADIMQKQNENKIRMHISYELTGGKYKIAEENFDDFSDDPKLKIRTGKVEYGFNIEIHDMNID